MTDSLEAVLSQGPSLGSPHENNPTRSKNLRDRCQQSVTSQPIEIDQNMPTEDVTPDRNRIEKMSILFKFQLKDTLS